MHWPGKELCQTRVLPTNMEKDIRSDGRARPISSYNQIIQGWDFVYPDQNYTKWEKLLIAPKAMLSKASLGCCVCVQVMILRATRNINTPLIFEEFTYPKSILLGSSMYSLTCSDLSTLGIQGSIESFTLTRNTTASRPSSSRWSYVSARYII